jgi:hypothetical protein
MKTLQDLKNRRDEMHRELIEIYREISKAEHDAQPDHEFTLDGESLKAKAPLIGAIVRMSAKVHSSQSAPRCMYLEGAGNAPDTLIRDGDIIPDGAKLYTMPAACGG